eukprot:jgi/Botrbrau1/19357/Bobra.0628s0002.1
MPLSAPPLVMPRGLQPHKGGPDAWLLPLPLALRAKGPAPPPLRGRSPPLPPVGYFGGVDSPRYDVPGVCGANAAPGELLPQDAGNIGGSLQNNALEGSGRPKVAFPFSREPVASAGAGPEVADLGWKPCCWRRGWWAPPPTAPGVDAATWGWKNRRCRGSTGARRIPAPAPPLKESASPIPALPQAPPRIPQLCSTHPKPRTHTSHHPHSPHPQPVQISESVPRDLPPTRGAQMCLCDARGVGNAIDKGSLQCLHHQKKTSATVSAEHGGGIRSWNALLQPLPPLPSVSIPPFSNPLERERIFDIKLGKD